MSDPWMLPITVVVFVISVKLRPLDLVRARKSPQCFCVGIEFWFARAEAPPKRLILFLIAAFCRLAKSLSHSQQMGWLVGAVGIEHNPRTTKSRGLRALQPPIRTGNCSERTTLICIGQENPGSSAEDLMHPLIPAASRYSGEHFRDDVSLIVLKAVASQQRADTEH